MQPTANFGTRSAFTWFGIILILGTLGFHPGTPGVQARAIPPQSVPEPPAGFALLSEDIGVQLYWKDYQQGTPDYVQVVDLSQGALVQLLHAGTSQGRKNKGMFGGDDTRFQYQSLNQFWRQAKGQNDKTFCVFNGQFFYMPENPTRLAMPLKVNEAILTEGFGYPQYEGQELMLEIWPGQAQIRKLSERNFYDSSAPNIIGGLTEDANKRIKYAVGRTFIGIDDRDQNNHVETIYVLNTKSATQAQAAATLRSWGADQVMMLDGGGSTQLMCRSGWIVQSERLIPQALAVIAGSGPPYQASFTRTPDWAVVVADGENALEIEVQNDGSQIWTTGQTALLIEKSPWGADEWLELTEPIAAGERAIIRWPANRLYRSRVYEIEASMTQMDRKFPGAAAAFHLVVLPANMADRRSELESLIAEWRADPTTDLVSQVDAWLGLSQDVPAPEPDAFLAEVDFSFNDIVWVPLLMLPFVGIIILLLNRSRSEF